MSVRIMAAVWELDGLDPQHKLVALAFADHANDDGLCYPSVKRIAAKCNFSVRHVRRIKAGLAAVGLLAVVRRRSGTSDLIQITPKSYTGQRIHWNSDAELAVTRTKDVTPDTGVTPDGDVRGGRTQASAGVGQPRPPNHQLTINESSKGERAERAWPAGLNIAAFENYLEYRQDRKQSGCPPWSEKTILMHAQKLAALPEAVQRDLCEYSTGAYRTIMYDRQKRPDSGMNKAQQRTHDNLAALAEYRRTR